MSRGKKRRKPQHIVKEGIPLGAPGAPAEGEEAGPDDDLREGYVKRQVRAYRSSAKRRFENAHRLAGNDRRAAEREARKAIDSAVRAFWWSEDSELEEAQHELIHEIGRWTRTTFGCHFAYERGSYYQRCPIAIAHKRIGLSIGFVGQRECAICGGDLSECPHIRGRSYWVRGGPRDGRRCAVCTQEKCRHSPDRLYRTAVTSIIREIDHGREVSWVSRPAQPEARLHELPIDTAKLRRLHGFRPGVEVSCDICLGACPGFVELPADRVPDGAELAALLE